MLATLARMLAKLLDRWMRNHAFVTWVETDRPWELEKWLLSSGLHLPLNIGGNSTPQTVAALSALRSQSRRCAAELDVVVDNGGPRKDLHQGDSISARCAG